VSDHIHLPDRRAAAEAADLIERFGLLAGREAAARAGKSREVGNLDHFCRWRQIGRIIEALEIGPEGRTRH